MNRILPALAAATLLSLAASANAATVTFSFTGACAVDCGVDGPNSNARTFQATSGSTTVNVRASAWSSADASTIETAFLGHYGGGLGVTNRYDDGNGQSNNSHTVDNKGGLDFVVLQFDQQVIVDKALLNAYAIDGTSDTDAQFFIMNGVVGWNQAYNSAALLSQLNTALTGGQYEITSGTAPDFNAVLQPGNMLVIASAFMNPDRYSDGFKIASLTVKTPVPAPEPAAVGLLGLGLFAVGYRARRRAA